LYNFRTATLLLFELTRDYNVILPLLASVGLAALLADILDYKFERDKERRAKDAASWGDLADRNE
jgi:H+/Cl- antiporter ClcA